MTLLKVTFPPGVIVGVVIVAVVILAVAAWGRSRERRDEWGPGLAGVVPSTGYTPADLRDPHATASVDDPTERWLLGLAAPFVENAALLHDRWSLVPQECGDPWKRHLLGVATRWGVTTARAWAAKVDEAEARAVEAPGPGELDSRPYAVAMLAMLLRLGVAARHTSTTQARRRLTAAASPLRDDYRDWLSYGDAVLAVLEAARPGGIADQRADLRTLYAPGGPWHDPVWDA